MLKKCLLLFICTIFYNKSNACLCEIMDNVTSKYQQSDFVAEVKIIKNYKNKPDSSEYYKADIEIVKLYKGQKIKQLLVLGTNGGTRYNSCGTFIAEGKTRLIFGRFDGKKTITTYLCDSYLDPNSIAFKKEGNSEKLSLLKKHAEHYTINTRWGRTTYLQAYSVVSTTTDSTKCFSLIKIVVDKNGVIKKVDFLTQDYSYVKEKLVELIKTKIDWVTRLKPYQTNKDLVFFLEAGPYQYITSAPLKL